jgi:hypothetical protein
MISKELNMTTTYTYDVDSFSDLYKASHGFRPGASYYEWLAVASPDDLQEEWDFQCRLLDAEMTRQEEEQGEALQRLKAELASTTSSNNVSVATAIRWMHDAYQTNGDNEYLDYKLGVKYGTIEGMLGIKGRNLD